MTSNGTTILGLVQQAEKWRTGEGEIVLVDSMTSSHLASVLRVLVSMEAELYGAWLDAGGSPIGSGDGPVEAGEVRAWFDSLPLVVRVRELLAEHNRAQRVPRPAPARPAPDGDPAANEANAADEADTADAGEGEPATTAPVA